MHTLQRKNSKCIAVGMLASHADVLRGSSRVPRGAGTRDEPLRTSAWEATGMQASAHFLPWPLPWLPDSDPWSLSNHRQNVQYCITNIP